MSPLMYTFGPVPISVPPSCPYRPASYRVYVANTWADQMVRNRADRSWRRGDPVPQWIPACAGMTVSQIGFSFPALFAEKS